MNARDMDKFLFEQDLRQAAQRDRELTALQAQKEREDARLATEYQRMLKESVLKTVNHDACRFFGFDPAANLDRVLAGLHPPMPAPGWFDSRELWSFLDKADRHVPQLTPAARRRGLLLLCPLT